MGFAASVNWRAFIDPYPSEKRQRKDVLEHAKIFVFGHGDCWYVTFPSGAVQRKTSWAAAGPASRTMQSPRTLRMGCLQAAPAKGRDQAEA